VLKLLDSQHDENDLVSLPLDDLARLGAKRLLAEALDLEVSEYIERHRSHTDDQDHRLVVRNGSGRARSITTGAGTLKVKAPRIYDRRKGQQFQSSILPPYLRRSANIESLLPLLYLKGLSGNAFQDALCGLLGDDAGGLSPSSISSLKKSWMREVAEWRKRLITKQYVYLWADGVNVKIRLGEDKKLCLLVLIGVTATGDKEVLAIEAGYRESAESWKLVFTDLIARGLTPPWLIIGDGALGLWKAVDELSQFKHTRSQRCWVHKIANVLDKLPKRLQPQAKRLLHDMMKADNRQSAEETRKQFVESFADKYPKATTCLTTGWENLVSFFDFPAAHWQHIRTTNPIESSFATVKQRTRSTKGAGNATMAEAMAFKLLIEAQKRWHRIRGYEQIQTLIQGGVYKDGILVDKTPSREAANS